MAFNDGPRNEALLKLATETGAEVQNATKQFGDELVEEIQKNPTKREEVNAWNNQLMAKIDERRKQLAKMMDTSMDKATGIIEALPPNFQEQAANAFSAWMEHMSSAVHKAIQFYQKAGMAIVDVWRGVVDGRNMNLENTVTTLQEWCEDSVNVIASMNRRATHIFDR